MEPHEVERLRRSIAMLPPGQASSALGKAEAEALVDELSRLDRLTARYREVLTRLRAVLDEVE